MASSHVVASHITKLLSSFRQILQFRFRENRQGRIPPWKVTKTRPFLSTCYGYPSTTEVPPCCQAATKKLTFSTTSVLLLLNVPLSLSRGTVFRRQTNLRRGYRPKIAGILFVCNEPEGKYYTVPIHHSHPQWTSMCCHQGITCETMAPPGECCGTKTYMGFFMQWVAISGTMFAW